MYFCHITMHFKTLLDISEKICKEWELEKETKVNSEFLLIKSSVHFTWVPCKPYRAQALGLQWSATFWREITRPLMKIKIRTNDLRKMYCIFGCMVIRVGKIGSCFGALEPGNSRGCLIIIWTGLNIKINIVQKVYEWSSCRFAKMMLWLEDHFGKKPAWSLIYFLNYAYFDI